MDARSTNQVLTLFGKWKRLFSTPLAAISFKKGRMVPFLDSCLILVLGADNLLRIFPQEAKFWQLAQGDNPEESRELVPKFEQCVRIILEHPEMQCFLCGSSPPVST
jgi:hypothetical protein